MNNRTPSKSLISKRFIAGLVDYILIVAITYSYILAFDEINSEDVYTVSGVKALPVFLSWLILTVGFEQFAGATLGNGIAGLKVTRMDGINKPDVFQSFKRHFLDPIDMFFFGLVGYVTMKSSVNQQRLGDLWAKTIVVLNKQS